MTDLSRLFEAFLGGNDAAFAELYGDINPRLSAYCHKLSPGHAEDLMQELWERVLAMRAPRSQKKKLEVINPQAFLFRMLKNLAIDHYRGNRSLQGTVISLDETPWVENQSAHTNDAPSDIEALVLEAFEKLSDDDREVLVLNIYSGYSYGEIAEMLGKSIDAIWQRASRARVKLRKIVIDDAKRMGTPLPSMNGNINAAKKAETNV